jgi:hypothetical protein
VDPAAERVNQPPECRFIPLPQPPYELLIIQIVLIIDACKILILRAKTKKLSFDSSFVVISNV